MAETQKNNYVSNSMWILLEKSARIISGLLVGVLVARFLGTTQFGTIYYGLTIIGIMAIFSTLGLDSLVVRELITRSNDENKILGTALGLRLGGSLVAIVGSIIYSLLRDPASTTFIVFLLSLSMLFQSFNVIDFYFQSQVKGKYTAINQVITLFISALIKLLLIYLEAPLVYFAAMAAFEALLSAFIQWRFYKKFGGHISHWKFSLPESKHLVYLTLPIILSSFIQMLYTNADGILIARFLRDMGLVGQYGAAVRISQASYFIPVAICAAVFPGIVNNRNNAALQETRLTQLYSLMLWGALFIIAGAMLTGDWVIGNLYGPKYPLAPEVFKLHVWSILPVFWGTAWGMWMLAEQKQKYVVGMQVLNAIIILGSELVLIPRLGILGAAWAVIVGSYIALLYMVLSYKPLATLRMFYNALNPKNLIAIFHYSRS
jgi:O-antigen/teichoic acid export membrane protein